MSQNRRPEAYVHTRTLPDAACKSDGTQPASVQTGTKDVDVGRRLPLRPDSNSVRGASGAPAKTSRAAVSAGGDRSPEVCYLGVLSAGSPNGWWGAIRAVDNPGVSAVGAR